MPHGAGPFRLKLTPDAKESWDGLKETDEPKWKKVNKALKFLKESAKVTKLNDGIQESGLTKKRTDRYIGLHKGHYKKGGQRSGTRYSLTNRGEQWAAKYLKNTFAKK